jgi:hypothetical protein
MPVSPFSRYRDLAILEVQHPIRGITRSLPIRRRPVPAPPPGGRHHRYAGYEAADLLALRYYGRENLYWYLMDANDGRLPDTFAPGELLLIPAPGLATQVERPRR